jgi:hypothetical protein
MSVAPPKYYEVNGQVCKLQSAFAVQVPANNISVIAAVTGQIIRVMGVTVQHTAAVGGVSAIFKNGSGGASLIGAVVPNAATGLYWQEPVIDAGYCETSVSTALVVDVAAGNVLYNVYYITYTP